MLFRCFYLGILENKTKSPVVSQMKELLFTVMVSWGFKWGIRQKLSIWLGVVVASQFPSSSSTVKEIFHTVCPHGKVAVTSSRGPGCPGSSPAEDRKFSSFGVDTEFPKLCFIRLRGSAGALSFLSLEGVSTTVRFSGLGLMLSWETRIHGIWVTSGELHREVATTVQSLAHFMSMSLATEVLLGYRLKVPGQQG